MAERRIRTGDETFSEAVKKHFTGQTLESVQCIANPKPLPGAEVCMIFKFENGKSFHIPIGEGEVFFMSEVLPN